MWLTENCTANGENDNGMAASANGISSKIEGIKCVINSVNTWDEYV